VYLATLNIRTTINAQNLAMVSRGVGGPIDVAVVRKTQGLEFISRERLEVNNRPP
jgi:hypothetical protein